MKATHQDRQLSERVKEGDPKAVKEVMLRFRGRIAKVVRRQLYAAPGEEQQELVHDILIAIIHSLKNESYKPERGSPLSTYICGVAHNKIRDYFKSKARNRISDRSLDELADEAQQHSELEHAEKMAALDKAIENLNVQCQAVLYWKYVKGLRVREIAQKLNLKPDVVSNRLSYAHKQLKKKLEKSDFSSMFLVQFLITI